MAKSVQTRMCIFPIDVCTIIVQRLWIEMKETCFNYRLHKLDYMYIVDSVNINN